MKQDYKLLRIFGYNGGSPAGYTDEKAIEAGRAGAPQTALYYNRPDQRHADPGRRSTWTDPKTGNVWHLYDEYMPSQPRYRLDQGAKHLYKQTLSEILKEIGFAEVDRVYADVTVSVEMEVDVAAWMTEYGADRATALEQIRNDIVTAIKTTFLHDKWTGLVDDVEAKLSMEA